MIYHSRKRITRYFLIVLAWLIALLIRLHGQGESEPRSPEFDTGKSGLALSAGYFRAVPMGEQAGWTMSLWFQLGEAQSVQGLFTQIVDENNG